MRVALLGDMAFFGMMSVKENPEVKAYFSEISDYLDGFDYVVGNLETPFSIKKRTYGAKSAYICADIENVQTLKQLHVDAVCLANNHLFDFGDEGYETTKTILSKNNVEYFGAEGKELRVELNGGKFAFAGFCCYTSNPLKCVKYGNYGVNAYNIDDVKAFIRRSSADGYLPITAVHAGLEHVNYPSIEHIKAARLLAEEHPYVYYGHHPHVIQGIEEVKGSVVAYSLGNFCFDDIYTEKSSKPLVELTENNRTGAIFELDIQGNMVKSWRMQIAYISKEGKMRLIETPDVMADYNQSILSSDKMRDAYTAKRDQILLSRINERKASRNLMWYLKRLSPRYLRILLNARKNAKAYSSNVLNYL